MDGYDMSGYLIGALALLLCVLVWLAVKGKSNKTDAANKGQAPNDGGPTQLDEAFLQPRWVDTIRREGVPMNLVDTLGRQTIATEVQEPSTLLDSISSEVKGTRHEAPASTGGAPKPSPITLPDVPILSSDPVAIDNEIAALHKHATASKGKDWPAAIAALEKAAVLDAAHRRWNDMTRMVRLPVFLQQAGRFDEAMAEFDRLIERVPVYVQEHATSANEVARSATLHREYEILYDKLRLACKREKQDEQAEKFAKLSAVHREALGGLKILKTVKPKKRRGKK